MNLDVILVKREKFHLVSHKVLQHLVYIWQMWICLIDSFWFERAGINCLSCHLYSLTFLCLVCWFSSLSWEIEFGQLCWQSALVFLRVLLWDRLRHPVAHGKWKFLEDCWPASGDYLYSSCTIIPDILSLWRNIHRSNEDHITHSIE